MAWHTIPKPTLAQKILRSQVTNKYGDITFYSSIAFLIIVTLSYILSPRLSIDHKSWLPLRYTTKRPSRPPRLPLIPTLLICSVGIAYLIFAETQQEFVFLAKRLGRVPVALYPIVYFLSMRPSPLPQTFYLQLIPLHKWLSRIIVVILFAHVVVYVAVYIHLNKLKKLTEWGNISGIFAYMLLLLLGASSLKWFRRSCYNIFYAIHYFTSVITLPMIFYHSKTTHWYMVLCGLLLGLQAVYRIAVSKHIKLPVQYVSPSLYFISIPKKDLPRSLQNYYEPGSHLRISNPLYYPSTWFQSSHPYTIASLPSDENLTLVVRKTRYGIKLRKLYAVTGPYGSIPRPFFQDVTRGLVKRVLFVAGGSGIAFTAPIMRHLRAHGIPVKLIWAIRDINEVTILNTLGLSEAALVDNQVEVYVTHSGHYGKPLWYVPNDDDNLDIDIDEDCCGGGDASQTSPLLRTSTNDKRILPYSVESSFYSRIIFNSRPVLNLRIKSWLHGVPVDGDACCCLDRLMMFGPMDTAGQWVLASGTETLIRETETWANKNEFAFFKDEFSL